MVLGIFESSEKRAPKTKALAYLGCFLLSLAITVLFFLADLPVDTDDDWTIALVLSGNYGPGGNCLFMNSALACLLYQLGCVANGVNWFVVFELVGTVLALSVFLYCVIEEVGVGLSLLALFFLVKFALPFSTYAPNYTVVTSLIASAGIFVILLWAKHQLKAESRGRGWMIPVGVALTVFGMCWRPVSFLLALPFATLALMAMFLMFSRSKRPSRQRAEKVVDKGMPVIGVGLVLAALCVSLTAFDSYMWTKPGWSDWKAYHEARSTLSDFPTKDYADISGELEAIGVSENDYYLVRSWATNDRDFFNVDRLQAIADIAQMKTEINSASEFLREVKVHVRGYFLQYAGFFLVVVFAGLRVILTPSGRKTKAILLLSLLCVMAGVAIASVYFIYVGRFPLRVCMSLLIPAVMVALFAASFAKKRIRGQMGTPFKAQAIAAGLIGFVALGLGAPSVFAHVNPNFAKVLENPAPVQCDEPLYQYVSNQDDVFVWDTGEYYVIEGVVYGCRYLPSEDFMRKNLTLGGWTTYSPFRMQLEADSGMSNVYKGLLTNSNAFYVDRGRVMADHVLAFLREHYDANAKIEEVTELECFDDSYRIIRFVA